MNHDRCIMGHINSKSTFIKVKSGKGYKKTFRMVDILTFEVFLIALIMV